MEWKNVKFNEIKERIYNSGYFFFGDKEFECPGEDIEYYIKHQNLPPVCDSCYKALIFWKGNFSKQNVLNLLEIVNSFKFKVRGKFNSIIVVFYFDNKKEMLKFLEILEQKMEEFDVKGKIEWRKACKLYQSILPQLWKNAKEFIPNEKKTSSNLDEFL